MGQCSPPAHRNDLAQNVDSAKAEESRHNHVITKVTSNLDVVSFSCLIALATISSAILSTSSDIRQPGFVLNLMGKTCSLILYESSSKFFIDTLTILRKCNFTPSSLFFLLTQEWMLEFIKCFFKISIERTHFVLTQGLTL